MMYTPTLSLPSSTSEDYEINMHNVTKVFNTGAFCKFNTFMKYSHYQLMQHNIELIMPEINNVLMEIGRIDVFKIYHGKNLLSVGIIDSPKDQRNIVSALIVAMVSAFNWIKDELPQSTDDDIAFIREFIGSFETNTLTVVIDI